MLREQLAANAPRVAQVLRHVRDQTPGHLVHEIELNRILTGTLLSRQLPSSVSSLHDVEFRVFSQYGDDGIIQYLLPMIIVPVATMGMVAIYVLVEGGDNSQLLKLTPRPGA